MKLVRCNQCTKVIEESLITDFHRAERAPSQAHLTGTVEIVNPWINHPLPQRLPQLAAAAPWHAVPELPQNVACGIVEVLKPSTWFVTGRRQFMNLTAESLTVMEMVICSLKMTLLLPN